MSFCWRLLSEAAYHPKIVATVLLASWKASHASLGAPPLAIIGLVVLTRLPFLFLIAESFGHAIALPHGVLAILVNWTWTVKELFVGNIKIALSAWLLYVVDEVFQSATTWLCSP